MRKYELSDRYTTADAGLFIEGDSLTELYLAGAQGMFAIILGRVPRGRSSCDIDFNLDADSIEQLLVDWLSELLFLFDARDLIPVGYDIEIGKTDNHRLRGRVFFREFKRDKETAEHDIKAVTYYKLDIQIEKNNYQTNLVFDL